MMHMRFEGSDEELIKATKMLAQKERSCLADLLFHLREMEIRRLYLSWGYSSLFEYCRSALGFSRNKSWHRSQAAKATIIGFEFIDMVRKGETHISNIALFGTKVTMANKEVIIQTIKGKSKREVEKLATRLLNDGRVILLPHKEELKIHCSEEVLKKFERAKEVLSSKGRNKTNEEVLEAALDLLLSVKDPLLKAERIKTKRELPSHLPGETRYIPSQNRYEVYLKDKGQCSYIGPDGHRCEERSMLEIDHIQMFCRGGGNDKDNLRLLCRRHNNYLAEQHLGRHFMETKRACPGQEQGP